MAAQCCTSSKHRESDPKASREVEACRRRTILSVEVVARSEGAAGQRLSAQAGLSCADNLHSGPDPAQPACRVGEAQVSTESTAGQSSPSPLTQATHMQHDDSVPGVVYVLGKGCTHKTDPDVCSCPDSSPDRLSHVHVL